MISSMIIYDHICNSEKVGRMLFSYGILQYPNTYEQPCIKLHSLFKKTEESSATCLRAHFDDFASNYHNITGNKTLIY